MHIAAKLAEMSAPTQAKDTPQSKQKRLNLVQKLVRHTPPIEKEVSMHIEREKTIDGKSRKDMGKSIPEVKLHRGSMISHGNIASVTIQTEVKILLPFPRP